MKLIICIGHVALEELLAAYSPQDEDARQKLVNLFLQVDVTRDQKLSLAGEDSSRL